MTQQDFADLIPWLMPAMIVAGGIWVFFGTRETLIAFLTLVAAPVLILTFFLLAGCASDDPTPRQVNRSITQSINKAIRTVQREGDKAIRCGIVQECQR